MELKYAMNAYGDKQINVLIVPLWNWNIQIDALYSWLHKF